MAKTFKARSQIVLAGAGHAHLVLLKQLVAQPINSANVTLVTNSPQTLFAKMVPGIIAGTYSLKDATIDVRKLCAAAGVEYKEGLINGVKLSEKYIQLHDGNKIAFRLLSLNLGSRPSFMNDESVQRFAVSIKPFSVFLSWWERFAQIYQNLEHQSIIVVGGGRDAVQIALAIKDALGDTVLVHLLHSGSRFLDTFPERVGHAIYDRIKEAGIVSHLGEYVADLREKTIVCQSGLEIPANVVLWGAPAEASADWLKNSGLALDQNGFVRVTYNLQSLSHAYVFAAGEIATLPRKTLCRDAMLGIRQGATLYKNLKGWVEGDKLEPFNPKKKCIDFIDAGAQTAIGIFGDWSLHSGLMWKLKRRCDGRFMRSFKEIVENS